MVRIRWFRTAEERFQLIDTEPQPELAPSLLLLRIVAEALIMQDEAEAVLLAVSQHGHLGLLAPRGGPLVRRFFVLRSRLPDSCTDPQLNRLRDTLDTIFYHHAMQVATALEFLAFDDQSAAMHLQVGRFTGLGPPARLLEGIYTDLKERQLSQPD